ncbi:MAG: transporter substrate-binding domain-containing protein [Anaerolineaceae bacterium]|jgi:hypothetical protein
MNIIKLVGLSFLALVLYVGVAFSQSTKCQIAYIEGVGDQDVAIKILGDVFKQAGIPVAFKALPGDRAKAMAIEGTMDGEAARIFSYGEKNPMLLRVPTTYYGLETTAYAKKTSNILIKNKQDLDKYKIAVVKGVQHSKDMVEGLENVTVVEDGETMMKLVETGKVDIALTSTVNGDGLLKKMGLNEIERVGTLTRLVEFIYFNKKNSDLVPKVDEAIKNMSQSGELTKLTEKYETEYLDSMK